MSMQQHNGSLRAKASRLDRDFALTPEAEEETPDIAGIYRLAAQQDLTTRNPVIFIPGIMGSKLIHPQSSRSVCGDFTARYASPEKLANRVLMALPMRLGEPLDRLESPSEGDGTIGQVEATVGRVPIVVGAYGNLLSAFGIGSYMGSYGGAGRGPTYSSEARATSFEFAYDWRRSLDESAAQLLEFMQLATYFVQARKGNSEPVKFDVVAHSMGGLLLRYFLRYGSQLLPYDGSLPRLTWAGAELVNTAIIIGTPNAGSLFALHRLTSGLPGTLVHPGYDPLMLGTMPAIYQLLPRARHRPFALASDQGRAVDLLDPALWTKMGWGLADRRQDELLARQLPGIESPAERTDIALEHLEKCLTNARVFQAALDTPAQHHPASLRIHLVAGDATRTPLAAIANPGEDKLRIIRYGPGDGTVLRSSALLDERVGHPWRPRLESPICWDSVLFASSRHMGLTKDPIVINNVLFHILEKYEG